MTDPSDVFTRRLALRSVGPADLPRLYTLMVEPTTAHTTRYRGSTPSPEDFRASFWEGTLSQLAVVERREGELVGLVSAYNYSPAFGHCYVAAFGTESFTSTGMVAEGLALFSRYLFDRWPLRKLYAEVSESGMHAINSGVSRYFNVEGRLREHVFAGGGWEDLYILALSREAFDGVVNGVLSGELRGRSSGQGLFHEVTEFLESLDIDLTETNRELDEVGIDSLTIAELIVIAESYNVDMPEDLIRQLRNLDDLLAYLRVYDQQ